MDCSNIDYELFNMIFRQNSKCYWNRDWNCCCHLSSFLACHLLAFHNFIFFWYHILQSKLSDVDLPKETSKKGSHKMFVCLMVFNATYNNITVISWRSVLLVEESRKSLTTLSHNVVHLALIDNIELATSVVIGTDCIGSCKFNYHTIMATMAPGHIRHVIVKLISNALREIKIKVTQFKLLLNSIGH